MLHVRFACRRLEKCVRPALFQEIQGCIVKSQLVPYEAYQLGQQILNTVHGDRCARDIRCHLQDTRPFGDPLLKRGTDGLKLTVAFGQIALIASSAPQGAFKAAGRDPQSHGGKSHIRSGNHVNTP